MFSLIFATVIQPSWWLTAVGPNVAAVLPCGLLGWAWSKTKFWPLNLLHAKLDALVIAHGKHYRALKEVQGSLNALHESHEEIHRKLDDLAKP